MKPKIHNVDYYPKERPKKKVKKFRKHKIQII